MNNDSNAKNCFEKALTLKEDPIILFNYIVFLLRKKMFGEVGGKLEKLLKIYSKHKKANEEYQLIEAQIPVIKKIMGNVQAENK